MDLELHKKAQEKLHGEEERIKQAMEWIEKVSGMQRVGEFPDCLKSGKMLCALANALRPGMSSLSSYSWCLRFHSGIIPHVNERPIPLQERVSCCIGCVRVLLCCGVLCCGCYVLCNCA